MLDMLGEDARSAVGKVKQLQSQGMTPDQIDAQMMEAARNGLLPISVAFAAQKALQRKNPPAPPPQGTVVGDMLGQLQGIAALPAPTMDNAQYAGGGIVAFAGAGSVGAQIMEDPITGDVFEIDENGKSTRLGRAYVDPTTGERFVNTSSGPRPLNPTVPRTPAPPASRTQRFVQGVKNVGKYDVGKGVKNLVSGITPGGIVRGVSTGLGAGMVTTGLGEGLGVLTDRNVDTDIMREYYGMSDKPGAVATGIAGLFGGGENAAQFVSDLGVRALGTGQRVLSMGLTGPDRPEAPAAAAAAEKPKEEQIDPATLNLDYEAAEKKGGVDPYAGLSTPSQAAGIRAAFAETRKGIGPTDESQVGKLEKFIDEEQRIAEKYELDKPLKGQQAKIAERRAKLDEDYSKSMLTDLGLAFLTKGVMAAGEGKDTLSAMAFAVGEGVKTTKERRERIDQIRDKLDDREATIETQLANMRENQITRGRDRREKELAIIRENKTRLATLGLEEAKALLAESGRQQDNALRVTLARIQASGDSDKINATERLMREYAYYSGRPDRKREAQYALDRIAALERTGPQYQAALAKIAADKRTLPGAGGAGGADAGTQTTSSGTRYMVEN